MEEPGRGILNKKLTDDKHLAAPPAFPTIKIEEPEQRGRSRSKTRDTGISSSRSISRSASRVSIKDQAYLKWTILNKDPSERLHLKAKKETLEIAYLQDKKMVVTRMKMKMKRNS